MKPLLIMIAILGIILLSLIFKGPISYERQIGISQEEYECGRDWAHVTLDNPFERIPINRVKISHSDAGMLVATAYFIGGVPYVSIEVDENCNSARRI